MVFEYCSLVLLYPRVILEAARYIEDKCDAIDLNFGCPQGIARRGHYGAFLMDELDLLHDIVSTLVKGVSVPVTCKTRIFADFNRTIKLCETLVDAGASMLTIHGRLREEKGHEVSFANWDMIRRIKAHFVSKGVMIPIVSNGGISNADDFKRCLEFTQADGVMTSEAILENPAFFADISENINGFPRRSQIDLAEEYLDLCQKYPGNSMRIVRSHMMKFLHRYFVVHEDIRDLAAKSHSYSEFYQVIKQCREYALDEGRYTQTWYHRHLFPRHEHAAKVNPTFLATVREKQYASSLYNQEEMGFASLFQE